MKNEPDMWIFQKVTNIFIETSSDFIYGMYGGFNLAGSAYYAPYIVY